MFLLFQGANGNLGKPGSSGDPVRLLKAISVFVMYGQNFNLNHIKRFFCKRRFTYFDGLNVLFSACLRYQGTKAEQGQKGDLGFKGDLVSLILPLDSSSMCSQ